MGRPRKEDLATNDELLWFKLENYSDLLSVKSEAERYRQWATVVRDRAELKRLLDAGKRAYVLEQFERIKSAPTAPLGFGRSYVGAFHSANTATIKLMPSNRAKCLHDELIMANAPDQSIADDVLASFPHSSLTGSAHLTVSLAATDEQLIHDFGEWLKRWREARSKITTTGDDYAVQIKNWSISQLLPYHDLNFYSELTGKSLELNRKLTLLFPNSTPGERESHRSKLGKMRKRVFSNVMAQTLSDLAETEESKCGNGQ